MLINDVIHLIVFVLTTDNLRELLAKLNQENRIENPEADKNNPNQIQSKSLHLVAVMLIVTSKMMALILKSAVAICLMNMSLLSGLGRIFGHVF